MFKSKVDMPPYDLYLVVPRLSFHFLSSRSGLVIGLKIINTGFHALTHASENESLVKSDQSIPASAMFSSRLIFVLLIAITMVNSGIMIQRRQRQTYHYPDDLRKYARPHPETKIYQGTLSMYGPQDWPKWYTRNMLRWNGLYHLSPYDVNDVRYEGYQRNRIALFNHL